MTWRRRILLGLAAWTVAAAAWLPAVHVFFLPPPEDLPTRDGPIPPRARALAARHLALWEEDARGRVAALDRMRATNAEWDFMGRTFLVLALANMAERAPDERERYLAVIDRVLADTLRLEAERGHGHFLMGYAEATPWVMQPPRSLFVDGEVALMLGARCLVADRPDLHAPLARRVDTIVARMERGPVLCAESYPDECWTFCNTAALAAVRIADGVLGQDHSDFLDRWISTAKRELVDPETGLLVSKFTLDGRVGDGPEGSSIWTAAHFLRLVAPAFARDQYARARRELLRTVFGFAYAREWPASSVARPDVDSGPIVPGLGASAGSSGQALVAAASFDDRRLLRGLLASLDLAAFPVEEDGRLRYAASNQVGDAVLLYSLVQGPLWAKAAGAGQEEAR